VDSFIARHAAEIIGVLSGFDRLVFRGTLIPLVIRGGMYTFLTRVGVQLLDFKRYVLEVSQCVKDAALREAVKLGRPIRYLRSSRLDKEALARQLLAEHPIEEGLICAFTVVEPCSSFEYHRSQDRSERGLRLRTRKCLHVYHYYLHPVFGWCSARIQTWFPFKIQICLNGREWLATQMARQGAAFRRERNCVFWAEDLRHAQRLLDRQLRRSWPYALRRMARRLNPEHTRIFRPWPMDYYWSIYQSEWATDVLFESPRALARRFPGLVRYATTHFQSRDVMGFLGRKTGTPFLGDIVSSFKDRPEGVRVKHWVKGNSIKMYDKAGSVLRVETTIGEPGEFKVLRPCADDPEGPWTWRPMRKGVADLHRRAVVSRQANGRYLEALAAVDETTPLREILDRVGKPVRYRGRRVRALRIGDPQDVALLRVIARGEFATSGFRNRDLRALLYRPADPDQTRRDSAKVSRRLRILRAHGIIRKVQKSYRYQLTRRGQLLTAALTGLRNASLEQVLALAA
jgi:hypothetical protein